jgi:hypothetical protein
MFTDCLLLVVGGKFLPLSITFLNAAGCPTKVNGTLSSNESLFSANLWRNPSFSFFESVPFQEENLEVIDILGHYYL